MSMLGVPEFSRLDSELDRRSGAERLRRSLRVLEDQAGIAEYTIKIIKKREKGERRDEGETRRWVSRATSVALI